MKPRLVVLAGQTETKTIELNLEEDAAFVLGRDGKCDLPLKDSSVSRKHCRIIRRDPDAFYLEDLNSHNGTFVNTLPVSSHQLKNGDRITFGDSSLVFLSSDQESDIPPAEVGSDGEDALDDGSLVTNSSLRLFPQRDTAEFAPDLNALVKLGTALNEISEAEALQKRILEIMLEFIPAERAAVLLVADEDLNDSQVVCVSGRPAPGIEMTRRLSRTVCGQVIAEQVALLSNDLTDTKLNRSESLLASSVTALLCVPLLGVGWRKGLIYFDASDPDTRFEESHLQQATAISFLLAAALSNVHSVENLKKRK